MKTIPLAHGNAAVVDDEDYEFVLSFGKWGLLERHTPNTIQRYARTNVGVKPNLRIVYMHILLMKPPPGMKVDHMDSDGLNNRRSNLRVCTQTQNQGNQRKTRGSSKYKGVSFYTGRGKWVAAIKFNSKKKTIGYFGVEEEAARAYDKKAVELFGEFARPNFPERA